MNVDEKNKESDKKEQGKRKKNPKRKRRRLLESEINQNTGLEDDEQSDSNEIKSSSNDSPSSKETSDDEPNWVWAVGGIVVGGVIGIAINGGLMLPLLLAAGAGSLAKSYWLHWQMPRSNSLNNSMIS